LRIVVMQSLNIMYKIILGVVFGRVQVSNVIACRLG
jgi:hypothetical protein